MSKNDHEEIPSAQLICAQQPAVDLRKNIPTRTCCDELYDDVVAVLAGLNPVPYGYCV